MSAVDVILWALAGLVVIAVVVIAFLVAWFLVEMVTDARRARRAMSGEPGVARPHGIDGAS